MIKVTVLALTAALGCTACATSQPLMPQAEKFTSVGQKKALAVQHWGVIASDVAVQTKNTLGKNNFLDQRALYVAPGNSPFEQSFSNYMISHLVAQGIPVADSPKGAVEVKYNVQVVQHKPGFNPSETSYVPGSTTAGVAGLWILRDAVLHASRDALIASTIGVAAAYDIYKLIDQQKNGHLTTPTGTELVITTSIADGGRYQMFKTDAYYIEQAEAGLFQPNVFAKSWGVVQ